MADSKRLMRNVSQAGREINTIFDGQLREHGLTLARARILLLLCKSAEPVSQSAITEHLQVEHPTAVRILDGLEALGYIERTPAPDDRRAKLVAMTKLGKPVAQKVVAVTDDLNVFLMQGVDPADAETANRVLEQLVANMLALKASCGVPTSSEDGAK